MTSLARQLERLAVPHTQAVLADDRRRVSLLFDPKEAANLDRSQVLQIGINGLLELCARDEAFSSFKSTLYERNAEGFERSMQTKEVNQRLNQVIHEFLVRLSPYFLLSAAHKALEWLIYRYHIHLYNVDDILVCILPYHDTMIFVRVLQLLKISNPTTKWNWLEPLQKPGIPLPASTLITHCYKDTEFLNFVCSMVPKFIKVFGTDSPGSPLNTVLAFYATAIVGALGSAPAVTDTLVAPLIPFVERGLKSRCVDYRAATYMIVCQLLRRTKLQARVLDDLLPKLVRSVPASLTFEAVAVVALVFETQTVAELPRKAFKYLCRVPGIVQSLSQLQASGALTELLPHLLRRLVSAAVGGGGLSSLASGSDGGTSSGSDHAIDAGPPHFASLLSSFLDDAKLQQDDATLVIRLLLDSFVQVDGEDDAELNSCESAVTRIRGLYRKLEIRYPLAVDAVVRETLAAKEIDDAIFRNFVGLSPSSRVRHAPVRGAKENLSLMLALNHADEAHRVLGVRQLLALLRSKDAGADSVSKSNVVVGDDGSDSFLCDSLLSRLSDDDSPVVVAAALELEPAALCSVLTRRGLLTVAEKLLHRQPTDAWAACVFACLRALLSGPWQAEPADVVHAATVVVLSLAAGESGGDSELSDVVFNSDFAKQGFLGDPVADHSKAKKSRPKSVKRTNLTDLLVEKLGDLMCHRSDDELASFAAVALKAATDDEKLGVLLLDIFATVVNRSTTDASAERLTRARTCTGWCLQLASALLPRAVQKVEGADCAAIAGALQKVVRCCRLPALSGNLSWWCSAAEATSSGSASGSSDASDDGGDGLDTLIAIFKLFTQCIAAGGPRCHDSRAMLSSLIDEKLADPRACLHFLCCTWLDGQLSSPDWSWQPSLGGRAGATSSALLVCRALFGRPDPEPIVRALDRSHCVVPSLTMLLGHPCAFVRSAALGCAKAMLAAAAKVDTSFVGQSLLTFIQECAAELQADPKHVQLAVASFVERCSTASKRKMSGSEQAAVGLIFDAVCSDATPLPIVGALLQLLRNCPSPVVFRKVQPVLQRLVMHREKADLSTTTWYSTVIIGVVNMALLYCDPAVAASFEAASDPGWSTFLAAIEYDCPAEDNLKTPQMVAIGQVTKEFFKSLSESELKQQLLTKLIDVWLHSETPTLHTAIGRTLRALTLDAQLLVHELQPLVKRDADVTVKAKRLKRTVEVQSSSSVGDGSPELAHLGSPQWKRAVLILELLQTKKKLRNAHLLIPVFFGILAKCLDLQTSDEETEYVKQLVLGCIHHACLKVLPKPLTPGALASSDLITEQLFSIELVVQCIRTSPSAQTHQRALLLLSFAAGLFPEHVLHNVMAIFTFMGANIMRQDDAYSFEVIGRTLDAVIPPLVEASRRKGGGDATVVTAVGDVVRVFVDAYPHVPEHRRLPLFTRLVNTLGPDEHLWLVMTLLTERHAVQTQAAAVTVAPTPEAAGVMATDPEPSKSAILDFQQLLSMNYTASVLVKNMQRLLAYLGHLPEDNESLKDGAKQLPKGRLATKKTAAAAASGAGRAELEVLVSSESLTSAQLRLFKYAAAGYISNCLSSPDFADKFSAENVDGLITAQLQALLEQSLQYITTTSKSMDKYSNSSTSKFWKALLHRAYDILDKINGLLPGDVFVNVVSSLLRHSSLAMQRKAMQLLNGRLQKTGQWQMTPREVELLLAVAAQLSDTVLSASPEKINNETETAVNTQTALYTLKLLASALAFDHPDVFKVMVAPLARLVERVEESRAVLASLFLCIAELVVCLRVHVIAQLSAIMPSLHRVLADESLLTSNELLWLSVVTAAQKMVDAVPNFLSPYVPSLLRDAVRLTCLSTVAAAEQAIATAAASAATGVLSVAGPVASTKAQLTHRLRLLRERLATCVAPRILIPAVSDCYSQMSAAGDDDNGLSGRSGCVATLMDMLSAHVSSLSKDDLHHFSGQLLTFFLSALDFRPLHAQLGLDVIASTEKHIFSAIVSMVMRLSEATFRPMFFKLYDWACRQGQAKDRVLVFYRLADCIADKLKGLFCLFAGHVVKNAAELLASCHSSHQGETLFGKATSSNVKKSCLLLDAVIDTLHKCFLFDNEGFTTKERFDVLMQPLVDQLDNTIGGKADYEVRTSVHLIPCISQLAVAAGDDSLWKSLNYQVCLKTRHALPKVRMAALNALRSLNSKLAQDYLPLLPETIPFLAELMEDESTDVEKLCQEVIAEMEEVLGEPLQKYF